MGQVTVTHTVISLFDSNTLIRQQEKAAINEHELMKAIKPCVVDLSSAAVFARRVISFQLLMPAYAPTTMYNHNICLH